MKFYFLASFIIFLLVFARALKKSTFQMDRERESFWEKESRANSVRKKSLEHLNYIAIPLETFPLRLHTEHPEIQGCIDTITELSLSKIVNLTGISNTDLKLTYGTANITPLSQYDQNYTSLVTTLQKWAEHLYALGEEAAVRTLLEFSISTDCDITKAYLMLAEIYKNHQETERIVALREKAQTLTSPSCKIIVRRLTEEYPAILEATAE